MSMLTAGILIFIIAYMAIAGEPVRPADPPPSKEKGDAEG